MLFVEEEGSDFMRGPREDIVGEGMSPSASTSLYGDSVLKRGFRCVEG